MAAKPVGPAGRYVPADIDAERAVVAALLTEPETLDLVIEVIDGSDFSDRGLQLIVDAVMACDASNRPVDQITVADELRRRKQLRAAGGVGRLEELVELSVDAGNVDAYARIVAEKSKLRRLAAAGREIAAGAIEPDADGELVTEFAEQTVFELGAQRTGGSMIPIAKAVPGLLEEVLRGRQRLLMGHPTGFSELDKLTGGFQPGQLIVIAARPAMGKSALALQIAKHMAGATGLTVPFLSYEMSVDELMMRMLASATKFDVMELRRGFLPAGADADIVRAAERMAELPLLIDDNPPGTISGVRSAMRRVARRGPMAGIVVDYLQLMDSDRRGGGSNRNEEVSDVSRGLKRLATELQVPIIALSQLSRGVEERQNKRPVLSDLRDSGAIEQDANAVMFVYRDAVYNELADATLAELIVAKQRSGPTGTVYLDWNGPSASFSTTTRTPPAPTPVTASRGSGGRGRYSPF